MVTVQIRHRKCPTLVAHMDSVSVAHVEEALLKHLGRPVGNHAVPLHLTKPKAALSRPALHRLARQHHHRPPNSRVDLVVDHMLEPLVVGGPDEDARIQPTAGVAVEQHLHPVLLVAECVEVGRDLLHRQFGEWRSVTLHAAHTAHLAQQTLNQMTDGHSGGDGVRVHDDVRTDAVAREGHVLLVEGDADGALLPVARRKFVADLRNPD
mmetsp:Transcript_27537/g.79232  ORF Transcript_27537/g.79232 Transcript_27537/m.79232 type:complete len:209 (+) Transcript_27537:609-1235(+)